MTEEARFVLGAAAIGTALLALHRVGMRLWAKRLLRRWAREAGAQIMLCRSLTRLPWPLLRHSFRVLARDGAGSYRNARIVVRPFALKAETRVAVRWDPDRRRPR